MIELLRALEQKWRDEARQYPVEGALAAVAVKLCADELSAILRDHSGEARDVVFVPSQIGELRGKEYRYRSTKKKSQWSNWQGAMQADARHFEVPGFEYEWRWLYTVSPAAASGSRSTSSEPDAAMWREAIVACAETTDWIVHGSVGLDWIEQRARELSKETK